MFHHFFRRKGNPEPIPCGCGCGEMVDRTLNEAKQYVDRTHKYKAQKDRQNAQKRARKKRLDKRRDY